MAIVALSILAKKRRSDQVRFSVPQLLQGSRERGNSGGVPRIAPGFRECGIHRTPETGDRGLERIRLGRMSEAQLCAPRAAVRDAAGALRTLSRANSLIMCTYGAVGPKSRRMNTCKKTGVGGLVELSNR